MIIQRFFTNNNIMRENIRQKVAKTGSKGSLTLPRIILLVVGGIIVGSIAGLFGGGGGIIVVPLLASVGLLEEREAHATSIAVILPMAVVSMAVYFATGTKLEYEPSAAVTIGVLLGGLIGTFLLKKLPQDVLKIIFYVVMIVAGIKMLL